MIVDEYGEDATCEELSGANVETFYRSGRTTTADQSSRALSEKLRSGVTLENKGTAPAENSRL